MTTADKKIDAAAPSDHTVANRRAMMVVIANSRTDDIGRSLAEVEPKFELKELRKPQTGLIMLRGRVGGDGAPFNLGEATVTRAAVQLTSGEKGFGYVLGRDRNKARLAATCDALWRSPAHRVSLERNVIEPLSKALNDNRAQARARTAATRVDFFTLVRGEDAS